MKNSQKNSHVKEKFTNHNRRVVEIVNLCEVYDDGITAISYKQTQLAVQSERFHIRRSACKHTHTHTRVTALYPGLPR